MYTHAGNYASMQTCTYVQRFMFIVLVICAFLFILVFVRNSVHVYTNQNCTGAILVFIPVAVHIYIYPHLDVL